MKDTLIAPYHLEIDANGELIETQGKKFDKKAYSRMKYGVRSELQRFAQELAAELHTAAPQLFTAPAPPALLTSYKAAAPPSTTLARYCLDAINLYRFRASLQPGEMVQVYRTRDYIEEYAVLPADERKKLIGQQAENTLRGRNLEAYQPVILDDICVTGTYTNMMRQVLAEYPNVLTACLIASGPNLKKQAHAEHMLNSAEIRSPLDLLPFIRQQNLVCTRRLLKMLLRTPTSDLNEFLSQIPDELLELIVRGIVDTDPKLQKLFPETSGTILKVAASRLACFAI
jgi:PRTase ComF-like